MVEERYESLARTDPSHADKIFIILCDDLVVLGDGGVDGGGGEVREPGPD